MDWARIYRLIPSSLHCWFQASLRIFVRGFAFCPTLEGRVFWSRTEGGPVIVRGCYSRVPFADLALYSYRVEGCFGCHC